MNSLAISHRRKRGLLGLNFELLSVQKSLMLLWHHEQESDPALLRIIINPKSDFVLKYFFFFFFENFFFHLCTSLFRPNLFIWNDSINNLSRVIIDLIMNRAVDIINTLRVGVEAMLSEGQSVKVNFLRFFNFEKNRVSLRIEKVENGTEREADGMIDVNRISFK